MAQRFVALATFHSETLGCEYCKGMTYTVQPGNDRLADLAARWEADGRVQFVKAPAATVGGSGKVH